MTAPTVLEFDVPKARSETKTPRIAFRLRDPDGSTEEFTMVMPKLASTAGILALIQDDDLDVQKHGARLAQAMLGLIDYIEPLPPHPEFIDNPDWLDGMDPDEREIENPLAGRPRGRMRIHQRLMDPDDAMDIEYLAPIFKACVQVLFKRPIGPSPASSQPQASDGSGSAEGSLDRLAATS